MTGDLILIALYAIAIRLTRRAVAPSLAFVLTIAFSFISMSNAALHVGYACLYLCLIPLANTRTASLMLISAIVNAASACYFLSSLWLEYFPVYFACAMIVINLCIIFTIFKGVRSEQLDNVDHTVLTCTLDLCNLLTHKKQDTTAK